MTKPAESVPMADYIQANAHRPHVLREYRNTIADRIAHVVNDSERGDLRKQIVAFDADLKLRGIVL